MMPVAQKSEQKFLDHCCMSQISCFLHPRLGSWACVRDGPKGYLCCLAHAKGKILPFVTLENDETMNAELKFKLVFNRKLNDQ